MVVLAQLFPAKAHLGAAAVTKYRELLRKINSQGVTADQGTSVLRDAKLKALLRLQQQRSRVAARLNPLRALQRLRDRLLLAQTTTWKELSTRTSASLSQLAKYDEDREDDGAVMQKLIESNALLRTSVLATLGGLCKAFLALTTDTNIVGAEQMIAALERPKGQGLITVSNHVASIDDPMVTAALLPPRYLLKPESLRWTLCATDRCFKNAAAVPFFRAGKVLPVDRGSGVDQLGMKVARDRLLDGEWIHLFPEGTRGNGKQMLPARRGVGWLAASCRDNPPMILPFVHSGMEQVVPKGAAMPRPGKKVQVLIGDPIRIDDLIETGHAAGWNDKELHAAIADRIGEVLYSLKAELDGVPVEDIAPPRKTAQVALLEEALLPPLLQEAGRMGVKERWKKRWESFGSLVSGIHMARNNNESVHACWELLHTNIEHKLENSLLQSFAATVAERKEYIQHRLLSGGGGGSAEAYLETNE